MASQNNVKTRLPLSKPQLKIVRRSGKIESLKLNLIDKIIIKFLANVGLDGTPHEDSVDSIKKALIFLPFLILTIIIFLGINQ